MGDSSMMYDGLTVLKTMEKIGILPALAFAQVIMFLVSNDYKTKGFSSIKNNIKKVLYISCILVGVFTLTFCIWPSFFLKYVVNKPTANNDFIGYTLPLLALLIICDVVQLILAAALRGGSDVKMVMLSRLAATFFLFIPLSWGISLLPLENLLLKFILLYGSVHMSYALMGLIYIARFKSKRWNDLTIKPATEVPQTKVIKKNPRPTKQQKQLQSTN
jgi:Na+-driven multidrug efflux pump